MLVSVVIPTFGRRDSLIRLITQILQQDTENFSYEIIVVDDGSPEPVEPFLESRFPRPQVPLRCLRQINAGAAVARNFGASCAAGELLVFVDDDMAVRPDFLRAHVEVQRVYGPALVNAFFDWEVQASSPPFERWYRARIEHWQTARQQHLRPLGPGLFGIAPITITAANLSVPREAFHKVGGFDPGYFLGCEDQDLGLRFELAGYSSFLTNKTIARHVETNNSLAKLCHRQARGSADAVRLIRRFDFEVRFGRQAIARFHDPIRWGADPWPLVGKKLCWSVLGIWPVTTLAFALIQVMEHTVPGARLLSRLYDLLTSAYAQKGWRQGLRRYASEGPLALLSANGSSHGSPWG